MYANATYFYRAGDVSTPPLATRHSASNADSAAHMAATAVMAPVQISSSTGLLAMLEEEEAELKAFALNKLNACVSDFWAEISESLPDIESLYEDESFSARPLAALVASKVYYYLGELSDALTFALGARALFDVDEPSEYVETLLSKAIDTYCAGFVARSEAQARVEGGEAAEAEVPIDARLIELVERMIDSSLARSAHQSVMGIAIEARRLDMVERVLRLCDTSPGETEHEASTSAMLSYTFTLATTTLTSRPWRRKVRARPLTPLPFSFGALSSPFPLATPPCALCRPSSFCPLLAPPRSCSVSSSPSIPTWPPPTTSASPAASRTYTTPRRLWIFSTYC